MGFDRPTSRRRQSSRATLRGARLSVRVVSPGNDTEGEPEVFGALERAALRSLGTLGRKERADDRLPPGSVAHGPTKKC